MIYGGVTAMVGLIAIVVVSGHVLGNLALDDTRGQAIEMSAARR
jgi:hypothetical protein